MGTVLDTFVEQIVVKKKGAKEYAVIFGSVFGALLLLALMVLFLFRFIGPLLLLILVGLGYGLWWIITSQNIEYEYSVTNGDIDIDQITAQRKRKHIVSVRGEKIETFAIYNPAEYANRHFDRVVIAAPSEHDEGVWCFSYHSKKNGHTLVVFAPEERVLSALKAGLPKLLQLEINRKTAQA